MASRLYVPVLLAALAACVQRPAETAPQPLVPKNGPDGHVRVEYEGGVFNRRLSAVFSVERPSYVMVAHLGGDGVIRVLYPEDARESGYVPGKRLFRTDATVADYDAAPGYWFMRPTVYRSVGAQSDSYDGNGHGFVFMIASDEPLRFDQVSEFGLWDEFDLPGYTTAHDPRTAIRSFANLVSPNGKYSLDYASNFTSYAVHSYAASRMDCAMLSSGFGMAPWSYGFLGLSSFRSSGLRNCGNSVYSSYAYWQWRMALAGQSSGPIVTTPLTPLTPGTPATPIASPKPVAPRPGRRDPIRPGSETGLNRPVVAERASDFTPTRRDMIPDRRATASERRATPRGEPVYRAPSTPHRGSEGGRGVVNPREARTTTARPRSDSPRPSASPSSGSSSSTSAGSSSSGSTRSTTTERASPPPKPVVRDP